MIEKYIDRNNENLGQILTTFRDLEIRRQENILSYIKQMRSDLNGTQVYVVNISMTKDGVNVVFATGNLFI